MLSYTNIATRVPVNYSIDIEVGPNRMLPVEKKYGILTLVFYLFEGKSTSVVEGHQRSAFGRIIAWMASKVLWCAAVYLSFPSEFQISYR